jgi:20S proteasome subunit alpha 2
MLQILGIKAKNGVVLACEKKLPSILMDEESFHKIELCNGGLGVTYAGQFIFFNFT